MYQGRLYTFLALATVLAACGSKKGGSSPAPAPTPAPTPTVQPTPAPFAPTTGTATGNLPQTFDPQLGREFSALPQSVVIAAQADAQGNPVPGTAVMHAPAQGTGFIGSADQAAAAFASGQQVTTLGQTGAELDQATSTQSWSSFQNVTNLSTYAPVAFSSRPGVSYPYGQTRHYVKDGHVYFVYDRPGCATAYCQPGQVPGTYVTPGASVLPTAQDAQLAQYFQQFKVRPLSDAEYMQSRPEQVALGERLFYDTTLSASGRMSCSTCHVERLGTANVYSLQPAGLVLTGQKTSGYRAADLLPRNVPALFNLGHQSLTTLFWDGRVSRDQAQPSGFRTPAGAETPHGLSSTLAAQALFPLVTAAEMGCSLGDGGNALQSLSSTQQWTMIMQRVLARSDYQAMFQAAYPEAQGAFGIQHLANAIAAFEATHWRADEAPFDRYLRGDLGALSPTQKAGAAVFYGKGKCAGCHSGPLFSDQAFHATGVPQFGPGAGDGPTRREDFGLGRVTGNPADRYRFRTPSLRNVSTTGPWGHDGAWTSLRQFVEHYEDANAAAASWDARLMILPQGFQLDGDMEGSWADPAARSALLGASHLPAISLSSQEVDWLIEFLVSLTDDSVAQNAHNVVINQPYHP